MGVGFSLNVLTFMTLATSTYISNNVLMQPYNATETFLHSKITTKNINVS